MAQNQYNTDNGFVSLDSLTGSETNTSTAANSEFVPLSNFMSPEDTYPVQTPSSLYEALGLGQTQSTQTTKLATQLPEGFTIDPDIMIKSSASKVIDPDIMVKKRPTDFVEDVTSDPVHKAKLLGESTLTGVADIADLVSLASKPIPIGSVFDNEMTKQIAELKGDIFTEDYGYRNATEEAITSFYDFIGVTPELEEPENTFEYGIRALGENIGALGPVSLTRQGLRTAKDAAFVGPRVTKEAVKYFDNWLKTEAGIAAVGAVGAAAGSGLVEGKDRKDQMANLGNLVFSIGPALLQLSPTGLTYKKIVEARNRLKETVDGDVIGGSNKFWEQHDSHVLSSLSRLVPEDQLPKLKEKMSEIRKIQSFIPEFRPSVGNVINTPISRQIQATVDTDNFEAATQQYRVNRDAVESLVSKLTEETDPAQKEVIASAIRLLREESVYEADRLMVRMNNIQQEIVDGISRGYTPDEMGELIKGELQTAQKSFNEHIDYLYKTVDPEGTARFDIEGLKTLISAVTVKGGLGESVNPRMSGYGFLTKELPEELNRLRGAKAGAESLSAKLGMKVQPQTLNYEQLYNIRKAVSAESANIKAMQDGSRVPSKLNSIVQHIDDLMTKVVKDTGDKELFKRHNDALSFFRDKYIPAFRAKTSGIYKVLRVDGNEVQSDQIPKLFWDTASDDATSNIRKLRDMFNENGLKIEDPVTFEAAKDGVYTMIEDFAVRDLMSKIRQGVEQGKGAGEVFSSWSRMNDTKLKAFPEIKKAIDNVGQDISTRASDIEEIAFRMEDLTNNVINKYTDVDASKFVRDLVNQGPLELRKTFRDIFVRNNLMSDFDPELVDLRSLDQMIHSIPNTAARMEAQALREAISENTLQYLLRRSMKTDGSGFDPAKLLQSLEGMDDYVKSETLGLLLSPKNRMEVSLLRHASRFLGDEIKPASKVELDFITRMLDLYGISAASISSRVYAHMLGKVGKVYIFADTLQRTVRGVSKKRAEQIYRKTMYDLEGLEKLIDLRIAANSGDLESLERLKELSGAVRRVLINTKKFVTNPDTYRLMLNKAINEDTLLNGIKLNNFLESTEDTPDESIPVEEDEGGLLDFYLKAYDEYNQQPSRTNTEAAINQLSQWETLDGVSLLKQIQPNAEGEEVLSPVLENGKQRITPEGRPVWVNQNGDQVTERTITVPMYPNGTPAEVGPENTLPEGASWYNIPTVYEGKFVSEDEAMSRVAETAKEGKPMSDPITGREFESFNDLNSAVKSAEERSPSLYTEPQASNSPVDATISAFEQVGVDPEMGLTFAQIESSLKPTAKAGTSSAAGLFQFIDSTWDDMVNRYGDKYGITEENADKHDPFQSAVMGAEYLKQNMQSLERMGYTPDEYNLYAAHFLGAKGAGDFLKAFEKNPSAKASTAVGSAQVKANPGIFRVKEGNKWGRERTLQEVMDLIRQKVDKARDNIQGYLNTDTNSNMG